MAGKNAGSGGASIGDSASVGLSYLGKGNKEIRAKNLSKPIDLWIKRSPKLKMQDYSFINTDTMPARNQLITYKFKLGGTQVSTHVQLMPHLVYEEETFEDLSNETTTEAPTTTAAPTTASVIENASNETYSVPLDQLPGYVFVLKFGDIAQLGSDGVSYDEYKIICPQGEYFFIYLFIY